MKVQVTSEIVFRFQRTFEVSSNAPFAEAMNDLEELVKIEVRQKLSDRYITYNDLKIQILET